MSLNIDDINIKSDRFDIPNEIFLKELRGAPLEERQKSIHALNQSFNLGELKTVETPFSVVFGNKAGEIEYFPPSGALWARNSKLENQFKDEIREWSDLLEQRKDGEVFFTFGKDTTKKLIKQAIHLLTDTDLLLGSAREMMQDPVVVLDQFAQLDEEGKEIQHGASTASVSISYAVNGQPVFGPGAKSIVFAEPFQGEPQLTSTFHSWREIVGDRKIKLPSFESMLHVGLLNDPELIKYHSPGKHIEITRLEFGYLALPAFIRQSYLFPALQVEGTVPKGEKNPEYFHFGRYFHVIKPEDYAKVNVYADYLAKAL